MQTKSKKNDNKNNITVDNIWHEMDEDWKTLLPYYNKTLDVWDRKMRLLDSNSKNKNNTKFNNFNDNDTNNHNNINLSLLERIGMLLDRPNRILTKMQSVEKNFKMYCDSNNDINEDNKDNKKENEDQEQKKCQIQRKKMKE